MSRLFPFVRRPLLSFATFAFSLACGSERVGAPVDEVAVLPAALARLAYTVDVSLTPVAAGSSMGDTTVGRLSFMSHNLRSAFVSATPSVYASLLGVDAFSLEVSHVERSILGRFLPGKVRVTFDVRLLNGLRNTILSTPTFPAPPRGEAGVYLFVVQSVAIDAPGSVSTTGNDVLVASPNGGSVAPSADWDGNLFDYIHGTFDGCTARVVNCARFERFDAPIPYEHVSEWRRVGFDVAPTVRHIRLRLVIAADVSNAGP